MAQDDLQSIVQRMIDAGEPEDNIALVIREYQPTERPRRSAIEMLGEAEAVNTNPEFMQGQAKAGGKFAEVALPILGGMAGGIPGAALGASAGGAIGRASSSQPITARNLATDAALGAAGQAAGPLIGKGIQKTGRVLGRTIGRIVTRPSKALRDEFGGGRAGPIIDTMLDEGVPTATMSGRALGQAADATRDVLKTVAPTAPPIRPAEMLDGGYMDDVLKWGDDVRKLGGDDVTDDVVNQLSRMERANQGGIPLLDAQRLKGVADDTAYAAGRSGNTAQAKIDKAKAGALRSLIEGRASGVADIAPMNARTQRLMGVTRALQEAEERPNVLTKLLSVVTAPQSIPSAVAMHGLGSSRLGNAAAIAIDRSGRAIGNPQTAKAALLSALLGPDYGGE